MHTHARTHACTALASAHSCTFHALPCTCMHLLAWPSFTLASPLPSLPSLMSSSLPSSPASSPSSPLLPRHWPELQTFIEKRGAEYKKLGVLKIVEEIGTYPVLKLKHAGGTETLPVRSYKAKQLEELLSDLVQANPEANNKKPQKKAKKKGTDEL
jgi:hypothetical protein